MGFGLLLLATLLGVIGLVYGLEGFGVSALFTLLMPLGASIGQVTLLLFGAFLAAAAVTSLAAMVLSQVTRNSVATMGILVGILLLTTLITAVPESPRLLSVLWYLLPSNFVSLQGAFRYDLLSVGGLSLTTWQVTPGGFTSFSRLCWPWGDGVYTAGARWAPGKEQQTRQRNQFLCPRLL